MFTDVVFVFLVGRIDAPSVVIATGALAALGALFFAFDLEGSGVKIVTVACTVVIAAMAVGNTVLHESGDDPIHIRYLKGRDDIRHTYEKWNAFSRVTVDGNPGDPNTEQLSMVIAAPRARACTATTATLPRWPPCARRSPTSRTTPRRTPTCS